MSLKYYLKLVNYFLGLEIFLLYNRMETDLSITYKNLNLFYHQSDGKLADIIYWGMNSQGFLLRPNRWPFLN